MRRITIKRARTWRYRRMPLYIGQSSATESLSPCPFCPVFIISTSGYDFRKGQVSSKISRWSAKNRPMTSTKRSAPSDSNWKPWLRPAVSKAWAARSKTRSPGIGHNKPPESIDTDPLGESEQIAVESAIAVDDIQHDMLT